MKTIFIDASVFYSACKSKIGTPTKIFVQCRMGKLKGYISPYIIDEVKRNLVRQDQFVKQRFNILLMQSKLKIIMPTEAEIVSCSDIISVKDAHVLAAAIKCNADYIVTFDKKDFMQPKVREFIKPIIITTPKKFLKKEHLI